MVPQTKIRAFLKSKRRGNASRADKVDLSDLPNARKGPQPDKFKPQLATLVSGPPVGDEWLHEVKFDGYRILGILKKHRARLLTRRGNDWAERFPAIARALESLPVEQAILDGEIVVLTSGGTTDFQALQNVLKGVGKSTLIYYVFDLPHCGGYDLTRTSLLQRKQFLHRLLGGSDEARSPLRYSDYIQGQSSTVYQHACRLGLEGLVSKRADSHYVQRRSRSWVKVKCLKRQEFVIGGYTDPTGSRTGFGALLLGYYDKDRRLIYCGRVGTGFDEQTLTTIEGKLKKIEQQRAPFDKPPGGSEARGVHWVAAELVAEVEFKDWTNEGMLRQPSFKGLREDKKPREVVRELPRTLPRNDPPAGKESRRKKEQDMVAGVRLTNPDRILFPEMGITKRSLAIFYEQIADRILPHIIKRPLMILRCPEGERKDCFYQKHVNETLPDAIRGIPIKEKGKEETYIVIDDLAGLISLVQLNVLEMHPWGSREDALEEPDRLVFDLDPGPGVDWQDVISGARLLHARLAEIGLESFVKTSGGKGLHVVVPLVPHADWGEVKAFAKAVAEDVAASEPRRFVAVMTKMKRKGKIFIDYVRNSRGATSVAAYSTRARPGAPVSTPLRWAELSKVRSSDEYTVENLQKRLGSLKSDPWRGFLKLRQSITASMKRDLKL